MKKFTKQQLEILREIRERHHWRTVRRQENKDNRCIGNPVERLNRKPTAMDDLESLLQIIDEVF